jgi:hypothetical protein
MNDNATTTSQNGIRLFIAWVFVGIPLAWGLWGTLLNVVKLFTVPPPT